MRYLKNLINSRTASAVVAAAGVAACSIAEPAQAGLVPVGVNSTNSNSFTFNLDDSTRSDGRGLFTGAIKNFKVDDDFYNLLYCGANPCPAGDLRVAKLTTDSSGNVSFGGTEVFTLRQIQDQYNNSPYIANGTIPDGNPNGNIPDINFFKDVLRYDVTFGNNPNSKLVWFIQSNDSNLINNLSGLSRFPVVGGFSTQSSIDLSSLTFPPFYARLKLGSSSQKVPEPTAMAGLFGVVALGAVSLLNRKKSLKNPI